MSRGILLNYMLEGEWCDAVHSSTKIHIYASTRCEMDPEVHLGSRRFMAGNWIGNAGEVPEDRLVRRELELEVRHEGSKDDL